MRGSIELPVNVSIVMQIFEPFEHILEHCSDGGFIQNPSFTVRCLHFVLDYVQQTSNLRFLMKEFSV